MKTEIYESKNIPVTQNFEADYGTAKYTVYATENKRKEYWLAFKNQTSQEEIREKNKEWQKAEKDFFEFLNK